MIQRLQWNCQEKTDMAAGRMPAGKEQKIMAKEIGKEMAGSQKQREMALFKFSLIAPLVAGTFTQATKMEYYKDTCGREHKLPGGKMVKFSPMTLKKWYWLYMTGGMEALLPKTRSDAGEARVFSADACKQNEACRKQFPHITGKKIYEKLVEEGYVKKEDASLDSLYRYLKAAGKTRENMPPQECLAFEFENANDCWQADTTFGPTILYKDRHRQTFLIVFIDDASRLITHGEFFFDDNALNMQKTFQKAILKYGVPRRLFVDNGPGYRNHQLDWICAELGIVRIHSKP